jgi:hypothetical protein
MENFEPLASRLVQARGALRVTSDADLPAAILNALDPTAAGELSGNAASILARHDGATRRIIDLLSHG